MQDSYLLSEIIKASLAAGEILLKHYQKLDIEVEFKKDDSPVTAADKEADIFISNKLKELSDYPVISEEGEKTLTTAKKYWLVDPLDGTKSFLKKDGNFTVNIGLIDNHKPVFGVIYVPAKEDIYFTSIDGKQAFKAKAKANELNINSLINKSINIKSSGKDLDEELVVVASKSHLSKETEEFSKKINVKEFISAGSSLKFCLVAEGRADIYPRFGPTMQWDTAAGHAILNAAGGRVITPENSDFKYIIDPENKDSLRNGFFIAMGN